MTDDPPWGSWMGGLKSTEPMLECSEDEDSQKVYMEKSGNGNDERKSEPRHFITSSPWLEGGGTRAVAVYTD